MFYNFLLQQSYIHGYQTPPSYNNLDEPLQQGSYSHQTPKQKTAVKRPSLSPGGPESKRKSEPSEQLQSEIQRLAPAAVGRSQEDTRQRGEGEQHGRHVFYGSQNLSNLTPWRSTLRTVFTMMKNSIKEIQKYVSILLESQKDGNKELLGIAEDLDNMHKRVRDAEVKGGIIKMIGGASALACLALAPFTFGTTLAIGGMALGASIAGDMTASGGSTTITESIKSKYSKLKNIVTKVIALKENIKKAYEWSDSLIKTMDNIGANSDAVELENASMYQPDNVLAIVRRVRPLLMRTLQLVTTIVSALVSVYTLVSNFVETMNGGGNSNGTSLATQIRNDVGKIRQSSQDLQKTHEDLDKDMK
ncbi:uncharacterized protein [Dendropsophus ebraccatus]|uniref:uncharacterized protein isoform X2 n=1 Tax=Dendropsophus ebraccatus TaxID=150705 RepID=UPI003831D689